MRENGVDSPYLFLHPGFSIFASLAHTEEFFKKTKRSRTYMRENQVDSPYLFLHCILVESVALDIPKRKKTMLKRVWPHPVDFGIRFQTIPDNPT